MKSIFKVSATLSLIFFSVIIGNCDPGPSSYGEFEGLPSERTPPGFRNSESEDEQISNPTTDNCCPLVWAKIIDDGHSRYFPSDAYRVGRTVQGHEIYFFWKKELKSTVGIIDSTKSGQAYFLKGHGDWKDGYVLTNPYNCFVKEVEESGRVFVDTIHRDRVSFSFCSGLCNYNYSTLIGWVTNGNDFIGFNMDTDVDKWFPLSQIHPPTSLNCLYVDCFESLKRHVTSVLYDMDLRLESLLSDEKVILAVNEVTNESDDDQMMNVKLNAEIISSLEMSHESRLHKFLNTTWGTGASITAKFSLPILERIFTLSGEVKGDGRYDSQFIKDNFTKTGQISLHSLRTLYSLSQTIKVRGKTKIKVSIQTREIQGTKSFTAYYKIQPETSQEWWTKERIKHVLRRIGFEDLDQIIEKNGTLVVPYKGTISIKTGFETHAIITSHSLDDSTYGDIIFTKSLMPLQLSH